MQDLANLPARFTVPSAWLGKDMEINPDAWLYHLTDEDMTDLETASQYFLNLDRDVGEITKESFPLTTFSAHVQNLSEKLLAGTGVEVLRGLPIAGYSQEFAATVFCGVGVHLGSARSQNAQGHI